MNATLNATKTRPPLYPGPVVPNDEVEHRVQVYEPDLLDDLVRDMPPSIQKKTQKLKTKRPESGGNMNKQIKREAYEHTKTRAIGSLQRTLTAKEQQQEVESEREFERLLSDLEEAKELSRDVDGYIASRSMTDARRKELLYKRWKHKVFDAIQHQVQEQLQERSAEDIQAKRVAQLEEYLSATKRGVGLFRDKVGDEDYDPFRWQKDTIKVRTARLDATDPLKQDLLKNAAEQKLTQDLHPERSQIEPRNRPVLELTMWDKLEATPHGRYAAMFESEKKGKPRPTSHSNLVLDHYNVPRNQQVVKQEFFPKGKKVFDGNNNRSKLTF